MTEQELVRAAAGGDTEAFERLVRTYENKIYHLALRMCGSSEEASDIAQEAFLAAWRGLPSFRGEANFATWLYRLTSNAAIDYLRRQKKERGDMSLDDEDRCWDSQLTDSTAAPDRALEQKELRRAITKGLSRLSEEHRQVLVLRELNGASYEEIGQVLGLPAGTVKSRVARARLALAKLLREAL